MGMDLYGKQGYFRFTMRGWDLLLKLAVEHGWEPQGTQIGPAVVRGIRRAERKAGKTNEATERKLKRYAAAFHGMYIVNERQIVTARDAGNLAEALERAYDHIRRAEVAKRTGLQKKRNARVSGGRPTRRSRIVAPSTPLDMYQLTGPLDESLKEMVNDCYSGTVADAYAMFDSREGRKTLREFIKYCRGGRFEIC